MKQTLPIMPRAIQQDDRHHFSITWTDGESQQFKLSDLQRACPCAACVDEITGERLQSAKDVSEDVQAEFIESVGSYAIRVAFTSGCHLGIFSFEMLRNFRK